MTAHKDHKDPTGTVQRTGLLRAPNPKRPLSVPLLQGSLKAKSRSRRENLAERSAALPTVHPLRNDSVPKLELVLRTPAELTAPARNVRKIEPGHLQDVMTSISQMGFCNPVLIDSQNGVLDGVGGEFIIMLRAPMMSRLEQSHARTPPN